MLLLIDAGNTRVKWALVPQNVEIRLPIPWLRTGSLSHETIDQLQANLHNVDVRRIIISNVAGTALASKLQIVLQQLFPQVRLELFRSCAYFAGLRNQYDAPDRLGSDRFASAIAANYLYPTFDLLVATCGTATTVDAVRATSPDHADARFCGGMILPGLEVMALSLAKNTAQLPQIVDENGLANSIIETLFAKNTEQAIASGCIHAQLGAIQCGLSGLQQTADRMLLVISGGAARYLAPYFSTTLSCKAVLIDNLVLTGLLVVSKSSPQLDVEMNLNTP